VEARPYKLARSYQLIKKTHHTGSTKRLNWPSILESTKALGSGGFAEPWFCRTGLGQDGARVVIRERDKVVRRRKRADFVGGKTWSPRSFGGWTEWTRDRNSDIDEVGWQSWASLGPARIDANEDRVNGNFVLLNDQRKLKQSGISPSTKRDRPCGIGDDFDARNLQRTRTAIINAGDQAKPAAAKGK